MKNAMAWASAALTVCALSPAQAIAQPQAVQPAQTAAPAPAPAPDPCAIPYTIGDAVKGKEIAVSLETGALKKLAKIPNIEAAAGKEVVRTAYAGMTNQAMEQVWLAYACRIQNHLKKTNDPAAAAKVQAVEGALAELNGHMAVMQAGSDEGAAGMMELMKVINGFNTRPEGAPTLDFTIATAALADVDPSALFLVKTTKEYWTGVQVSGVLNVNACGGVVRAALSDGGSSLQVALASSKQILINYLDPNKQQKIALLSLLNNVTTKPTVVTVPNTTTFKGCATQAANTPPQPSTPPTTPTTTPTNTSPAPTTPRTTTPTTTAP